MARRRFTRLFVFLTLVMLLGDIALVAANYRASRRVLDQSLAAEGERLHAGYDLAVTMTFANMLELATFIAGDPDVRAILAEGATAVMAEGGGGARAAAARKSLLSLVDDRWQGMARQFGVRQLQFLVGPGAVSFLRVHAPSRFGDRLEQVRPILADVMVDGTPRVGMETGRVNSGLRGVVPVVGRWPATGETVQLGAVEVGSGFMPVLGTLDQRVGAGFAVILDKDHADRATWEDFVRTHCLGDGAKCGYLVEAASRDDIYDILAAPGFQPLGDGRETVLVDQGDRKLSVTRFPLLDYRGTLDAGRGAVGSVVAWTDASQAVAAFRRGQVWSLVLGVLAFVVAEGVLVAGMRLGAGRLRRDLIARTDELRDAAERNRAILDAAAEGICGTDAKGLITFVNAAAGRMLGWTPEDLLGRPQHAAIHHTHPDGTVYEERYCPVQRTLWDGKVRHVTGEVYWRRDGSRFATEYCVAPLLDRGGAIVGSVVVFRDDTERLQARRDLAAKTAQLQESNAELAQFASIVSHDLQTPLRMVTSYLGLIERRLGPQLDGENREFLDYAIDGGKRMSAMIRDLLAYSRVGRDQGAPAVVDLAGVLEAMREDLAPAIADSGAALSLPAAAPSVRGRQTDLVRLFENLVGNAIKYRSPDRPLVVAVTAEAEGGWVTIRICDNGQGIPADQRERIFGFFHRVGRDPDAEGSGIGLAVARKIVGQHGGRIWVEDNPDGVGSCFTFTLPGEAT